MSRPHSLTLKEQNIDTDYVFFNFVFKKKWDGKLKVQYVPIFPLGTEDHSE